MSWHTDNILRTLRFVETNEIFISCMSVIAYRVFAEANIRNSFFYLSFRNPFAHKAFLYSIYESICLNVFLHDRTVN